MFTTMRKVQIRQETTLMKAPWIIKVKGPVWWHNLRKSTSSKWLKCDQCKKTNSRWFSLSWKPKGHKARNNKLSKCPLCLLRCTIHPRCTCYLQIINIRACIRHNGPIILALIFTPNNPQNHNKIFPSKITTAQSVRNQSTNSIILSNESKLIRLKWSILLLQVKNWKTLKKKTLWLNRRVLQTDNHLLTTITSLSLK